MESHTEYGQNEVNELQDGKNKAKITEKNNFKRLELTGQERKQKAHRPNGQKHDFCCSEGELWGSQWPRDAQPPLHAHEGQDQDRHLDMGKTKMVNTSIQ